MSSQVTMKNSFAIMTTKAVLCSIGQPRGNSILQTGVGRVVNCTGHLHPHWTIQ